MSEYRIQGVTGEWEVVIGLEVHAQLLTQTKIFCACSTSFGAAPNAHTCPVCLGMPGALPVLNAKVVDYAIKAGLALGCRINERSVFARKNYFYPDLPKGYQISQYDLPLCHDGNVEIPAAAGGTRAIGIIRAHLEEDTGKLGHELPGGHHYAGSLVDLNRAGTPLLEGGDGGLGHGAVVSTRLVGSLYALKAHAYARGLQICNQYQLFATDLCARPW